MHECIECLKCWIKLWTQFIKHLNDCEIFLNTKSVGNIFKLQWWKFSLKYKNGNIFIVFIYIAHSLYKIYFMLNVPTFCKWIFLKVHTFCEREIWEKKKHKKGKMTETAMKQRSQIVVHKNCLCDTHDSIFSGISYKKNDWSEAVMNFV